MQLYVSLHAGTKLSGTSGVNERTSTAFFQDAADTAELCVPNSDDRTPCEADITGIVTLISVENLIEIGEPSSAQVIVQDDDCKWLNCNKICYEHHKLDFQL